MRMIRFILPTSFVQFFTHLIHFINFLQLFSRDGSVQTSIRSIFFLKSNNNKKPKNQGCQEYSNMGIFLWNISNHWLHGIFQTKGTWKYSETVGTETFPTKGNTEYFKAYLEYFETKWLWILWNKGYLEYFEKKGYLEYFKTKVTLNILKQMEPLKKGTLNKNISKKGYLEYFEKRYLEYFETKGTLNILKQRLPGIFRPILCSSSPPSSSGSLCTPSLCPQIFPQESKSPEAICVGLDADAEKYQQPQKSISSSETAEKWVKTLGKNQVLLFWARWSTLGFPARRQRLDGGLYSTRASKQRPPHLNRRQPAKVFRKL